MNSLQRVTVSGLQNAPLEDSAELFVTLYYSQLPDREKKSVYPKNFSRIPCGLIVCVCVWMAIHRCRWHKTMKLMTFQTVHALPFSFACGCIQHFCALHLFIDASSASHTHTHTYLPHLTLNVFTISSLC